MGLPANNLQWDDKWFDERETELQNELDTGFDIWSQPVLMPKLQGQYIVRLLPPLKKSDLYRAYGEHWNLFGAEDAPKVVGCPKLTWAKSCPVCDAADALVTRQLAERKDIYGMSKWGATKRFLIRCLLVKFVAKNGQPAELPELPVLRYMSVPGLVVQAIRELTSGNVDIDDVEGKPKNDRGYLYDPDNGHAIIIKKDDSLDKWWSVKPSKSPWKVPDQFRDPKKWGEMDKFLPKTTAEEINELLKKHYRDIPELLSSYLFQQDSVDAEAAPVKHLKSANPPQDEPWGDDDLEKELNDL